MAPLCVSKFGPPPQRSLLCFPDQTPPPRPPFGVWVFSRRVLAFSRQPGTVVLYDLKKTPPLSPAPYGCLLLRSSLHKSLLPKLVRAMPLLGAFASPPFHFFPYHPMPSAPVHVFPLTDKSWGPSAELKTLLYVFFSCSSCFCVKFIFYNSFYLLHNCTFLPLHCALYTNAPRVADLSIF